MKSKYNISVEFLQQEYIDNKRTLNSIAKEIGCTGPTIKNILKKYNLPIRQNHSYENENILNQKFGELTVLEKISKKQCKCLCSCGTEKIVYICNLKKGHTTSCGCFRAALAANRRWTGFGEISGHYWSLVQYGCTVRSRKIEFNITIEYTWNLFLEQDRKCALSGQNLIFAKTFKTRTEQTASLDRIDSSKGYIEGNVQWVHKNINIMKSNFTEEDFINWCELIAKYRGKNV